ncbi:MAG: hypothetical protein WC074_07275 [bacterium]
MSSSHNRTHETAEPTTAWERSAAEPRLLYGRRRLSKTYMLQHFLRNGKPHCYFPASAMTIASNIEWLAQVIIKAHPQHPNLIPANLPTLWSILQLYGEIVKEWRFALILDEFQYLAKTAPSIPSQSSL